jgi:hypothetical protein
MRAIIIIPVGDPVARIALSTFGISEWWGFAESCAG